ncbi:unannotated protein [freshwater metagenome]|uniref:Unannotated protein n=1 Tax=freshwater metagenome TaxID=449393 RepID=A0A6J7VYZ9_9ZZZZ
MPTISSFQSVSETVGTAKDVSIRKKSALGVMSGESPGVLSAGSTGSAGNGFTALGKIDLIFSICSPVFCVSNFAAPDAVIPTALITPTSLKRLRRERKLP